ncbi:MAG TPA: phage portal protein [Alphaproteobacteria bacterium]|nr:phage portal protein [Alphaproteobacteria bacterium]
MKISDIVRGWFAPRAQGNTITTSKQLEEVLLQRDGMTRAGITVTQDVAMMVAALSAAVSLISECVAMLPLIVYRRREDDGKDRVPRDPLYRLLHDKPNDWQSSFEFREMLTAHLMLWGNGYAFKNRLRNGRVAELLPIHPDRVEPKQDEQYRITYKVNLPSGEQVTVAADRIFHLKDRSFDGVKGLSRLKSGRDTIGLALIAERWGAQLFGNSARPSGVLTSKERLSPEQMKELRESWQAQNSGENALGTAVLDAAFDWKSLAFNNSDAQYVETRKFQIAEIARLYRIPPHMLGDLERATFSNIEQQSLEFVKYTLMPWLRRWETAIGTQLIGANSNLFAEFLIEGFLRGDTKSRYESYAIALQNKIMNVNEVRTREGMNPREGGEMFENPAITPGGQGNEPAQTEQG